MLDRLYSPPSEIRLEPDRDMRAYLNFMRGDPRLSSWEEGFLASVAQIHRSGQLLTAKQWHALRRIGEKVAEPYDQEAAD